MRIAAVNGAAGTTFTATRPPGYSAQPAGGFTAQPGAAGGAGLAPPPPPPFGAAVQPSAPAPPPPSYGAATQPGGVFDNAVATTQPTSNDLYGPSRAAAPGTGFSTQYSTPASYGSAFTY